MPTQKAEILMAWAKADSGAFNLERLAPENEAVKELGRSASWAIMALYKAVEAELAVSELTKDAG